MLKTSGVALCIAGFLLTGCGDSGSGGSDAGTRDDAGTHTATDAGPSPQDAGGSASVDAGGAVTDAGPEPSCNDLCGHVLAICSFVYPTQSDCVTACDMLGADSRRCAREATDCATLIGCR